MGIGDTTVQRARRVDLVPGYRLIQLVGKGGMGEVHQAVQLSLGRTVAVKLLSQDLAQDDTFVARFEKEGAALATLRHPNIVSIVDRGKTADTYYLVMEFVDGPSLRERMRDPDFDSLAALKVLTQIARAIDYAHGRGVIHRDLKPENILFDDQAGGLAKVTDFGLAGLDERSDVKEARRNLTQTHMAMGTAAYMAPEQRVDAKTAGPPADLYSLGVMLYELLVGDLPMGNFDPPSVRKPSLDKRLDAIIARCLKPAVEDRYPSVAAFLTELEPLIPMTVGPMPAKETGPQRVLRKTRQVARSVWRGVTLSAALASLVIVGTVFIRARLESRREPPAQALLNESGVNFALTTSARFDKTEHSLELGEGPDTVGLRATSRQPLVEHGVVSFGKDSVVAGRVVIDAQTGGDGLTVRATVKTQATERSTFEPLYALFRGPKPEARSALMLLGKNDRHVTLIVSASGSPPLLEWALGPDLRGEMTGSLQTGAGDVPLELRIAEGKLFAFIGSDRDARILGGNPLSLGPDLEEAFGEFPRLALGCLEGSCVFHDVSAHGFETTHDFDLTHVAPPAPPATEVGPPSTGPNKPIRPVATAKSPAPPPTPVKVEPKVPDKRPVVGTKVTSPTVGKTPPSVTKAPQNHDVSKRPDVRPPPSKKK